MQIRTDDPDARYADGSVLLTDPPDRGPLVVATSRPQSGGLLVAFQGVADRTAAEALRGTVLLVDPAALPPPEDPDDFYDFQLVGLAAELPGGEPVGTVAAVLHLPQGDVLAVQGAADREVLVPFVSAIVPIVDLPGGRLVVDPPAGLLDLPDA